MTKRIDGTRPLKGAETIDDMLKIIQEQIDDPDSASFALDGFKRSQLKRVMTFVESFRWHAEAGKRAG
jgi:hypothetical protein